MWFEILKAGSHTASSGQRITFDERTIDEIVGKYNPAQHEAPVVIGHPADNQPAYGWVESLKRVGGVLMAKLKLIPAFAEVVKQGLFKKRSVSLYPDMTLRHVGFLGAVPPSIKGLADIQFKEGAQAMTFEFGEREDAAAVLARKISEVMRNPPPIDRYGNPMKAMNFSEAFNYVTQENPELAREYFEAIIPKREKTL